MSEHEEKGFEDYRLERKRQQAGETRRPLNPNAVIREIEDVERREARNEQLTREVHEFFAEATRTAAAIVSSLTENVEASQEEAIRGDMSEFLHTTINRAQEFVTMMRETSGSGVALQDVEANMHNLASGKLDGFRAEGTAQLRDKHIGQDPFKEGATEGDVPYGGPPPGPIGQPVTDAETSAVPDEVLGSALQPTPQAPVEDSLHLAWPSISAPEDQGEASSDSSMNIEEHPAAHASGRQPAVERRRLDPLTAWFARVAPEDKHLRKALKVLVKASLMAQDEATAIYELGKKVRS